jgi:hypothetical protein
MNLNIDPEWFLQMSEKEDNRVLSVDGYWSKIKQELDKLDAIVLTKLKDGPMSVAATTKLFQEDSIKNPEAAGKRVSWSLVERGKARFNDEWLLEIMEEPPIPGNTITS